MPILTLRATGGSAALPPASVARLDAWRASYNQLIAGLAAHFDVGSEWWFVPLSTRDRFMSSLQDDFQKVAQLEEAIESGMSDVLAVVCGSGELAAAMAELARRNGWSARRPLRDHLIWGWRGLRRRACAAVQFASREAWIFRQWRAGQRMGDWRARTSKLGAVFAAPIHLPPPSAGHDLYFGGLPLSWSEAGEKVAVVGPALCDPRAHARWAAAQPAGVSFYALDSMIGFADAAWLMARGLRSWAFPPRAPKLSAKLPLAERFVRREIAGAIGSRVHGHQLERAFAALLRRSPNVRVLHTYENNWWERAIDRPANARVDGPDTVGYLHCPVIASHLKYFVSRGESNRPAPQRVVCTGPAARDVYLSLGEYDSTRVIDGAALRGPEFASLPLRQGPVGKIRSLLVVLEGLPTMAELLRLLDASGEALAGRRVVVRPHPVLSLETLADAAGLSLALGGSLTPSDGRSLLNDIAEADAVIFKASNAALTAGYMGLPLIRYRDGWWLSDDPLRDCTALKVDVSSPADLAAALAHFEAMAPEELERQRAALRDYLGRYFAAPTPETLGAFVF